MNTIQPLLIFLLSVAMAASSTERQERPVIGILSEPNMKRTEFYVASSYVKWLEAAGARSIVIPFEANNETVEDIFGQINGALLPGGSAVSHVPDSVRKLLALAKGANDDGDTFPIWGTCLGFEYLIMAEGTYGRDNIQGGFDARNIALPLKFTDAGARHSRAFAEEGVRTILASSSPGVAMNFHTHGVEPERFWRDEGLTSTFRLVATSADRAGREFVSAVEARDYPFFGVQFHPEKTNFEYASFPGTNAPYCDINHSADAVLATFKLAHFFVSEARKNKSGTYTLVVKYPLVWTYDSVAGETFEQRLVISRSRNGAEPVHVHWSILIVVTIVVAALLEACRYAKRTGSVR